MPLPARRVAPQLSLIRERTHEAAVAATRHILPQVPETEIAPTRLNARVIYLLDSGRRSNRRVFRADGNLTPDQWSESTGG